ncbi:MAG: 30S ribosomal protein S20 [Candidatus Shapirobacteria bacterium]
MLIMPISQSAKKSLRKALKNNKVNVSFKIKLKAILKKFSAKPTESALKDVYSVLDKAIKNNIYHPNKVSRLKAKFSRSAKSGLAKVVDTKKKTVKKVAKKNTKKAIKKANSKMVK